MSDANILLDRADGEPSMVYVEMTHGGVWISRPANVAKYVAHAERLWGSALVEDEARALLAHLPTD